MEDKKSHETLPQMPEGCSAATLRELRGRAQTAIEAQRRRMDQLEKQIQAQLQELQGAIAEKLASGTAEAQQAEQTYEDARRMRKELEQAQTSWQQEQEEINSAIADRQQELDRLNTELDERAEQLEARDKELAEREQAFAAAQQELENERTNQAQARDQESAEREQTRAAAQQELENERANSARQKSEWDTAKAALESERTEVQNKFDLALGDVQRLRRRVAELEQDLASRPEVDDGDSAELVHLRAERDALAERVEELEHQPAPQVDSDSQRQLTDLQRRFELAVEDVRELKTLNAKLEARLAEAEQRTGSKADGGTTDWEAQKQRLLASLSEDEDSDDPAVRKERATIEGTIRITDDVIAKKDDEIARLREQLAASPSSAPADGDADPDREAEIDHIINSDEIIQQHRKKLAQLEKEMEEKLRAAELELSVERAKIARKQVELNDWRAELESMQESRGSNSEGGKGGVPKRRWLSKLGLGSEEEQQ